ncbi:hypothetical protein BH11MYX3_BH11MYX3_23810 [soil metagenome]
MWIPCVSAGTANLDLTVAGAMSTLPTVVDDGGITFVIVPVN